MEPVGRFEELEKTIRAGAAFLPESFRDRHACFIRRRMNEDGGFAGRAGGTDIYYTSFALRAAELVGIREETFWERAARHVGGCAESWAESGMGERGPVEIYSLLSAAATILGNACPCRGGDESGISAPCALLRDAISGRIARSAARRLECGLAGGKSAGGTEEGRSLYLSFLAARSLRILGVASESLPAVADFVLRCRTADGGFSDSPLAACKGERPDIVASCGISRTAAAVALLVEAGRLDESVASSASAFLASLQKEDGGLAAWEGAPMSDLLSSFTGLAAAWLMGRTRMLKLGALARFVRSLESEGGGFRGSMPDSEADVEYTYYGVATLGLLAAVASGRQVGGAA
jgi:geranylgeranyl transferase type-2 subunit beta